MKRNNPICVFLRSFDYIIAGTALIVLIVVTFLGIIMRRFLNSPFVWQEEVQLFCMVWIVYFGGSAAFRSESHISIDVIVELFPQKVQKIFNIIIYFIVMVVFGYALSRCIVYIQQLISTNRHTNLLHVPYCVIYAAVPIGFVLMGINYTLMTFKRDLLYENLNPEEVEKE